MNSRSKTEALSDLYRFREKIEDYLAEIESILRVHFPDQYDVSYQHWIPQIKTALRDNTKWLPRGQYSMDYVIAQLVDKIIERNDKGVSKYIK